MKNYFVYVEGVDKQIHVVRKENTWYGIVVITRQEWELQGCE